MIGRALIFVFGIPSILGTFYFGKLAYAGECVQHYVGVTHCGSAIYFYSGLLFLIFLMTLGLAYYWRD